MENRLHSDDRILVLKPIEGQLVKNTIGLTDTRLFKGGNTLHAIRDPLSNLWYLKYQSGIIPEALKQRFTKFSELVKFTEGYYNKRGLKIEEVVDQYAEIS